MSVSLTPDIQKLEENVAALRRAALWLASMENDDVTSVVEHEQERRKKPPTLDNMLDALAFTLVRLFDASGQVDALEEAISTYEETLRLRPPGHPRRMISVGALGAALWRSCEKHQRDDARIRRAIDLCREALQAHPLGQPERDIWLNYVAVALQTSFLQQGGLEKLDEAISLHREALTLRSPGHAHRDTTLVNLASACKERFLQLGSPDDLAEAITLYREAVQLHPSGHPSRDVSMDNLADALRISFDNSGEVDVLSEALTMHRAALDLRPIGHPLRGISLNNLGLVLHSTFGQQGGLERLSEAVSLLREALQLHPPGHPYRGTSLNTLAVTLQTMYDHLGGLPVLDEVIALQREALVLRSSGSAEVDVGTSLNNLGNALTASFYQSGRFEDLAEAIALYRSASELRSAGHLNRVRSLNNLAAALKMRYDHIGGSSTLAEALLLYREVVKLHPPRHPDRGSSLSNLSKVLQASYEENREVDVLEEAIALQREALQLHPQGHPLRRNSLRALAMGLRHSVTSGHQSSPEALLEAISLLREDLELSYPEHPMHCLALWGLAMMLRYYDEHTPDAEIWNEAVDNYEQALRFCVPGHSHRARLAAEASKCFLLPSRPESFDFATGTRYVHVALSDNNAPAKVRLRLAASNLPHVMHAYLSILLANAQLAAVADGSSVLDLYRQAIQLLPRAVNFGLYPEARLDVLGDGLEDLSRVGAVCILLFNHDNVAEAVEILEEGRNIFWSQALHLRASGLDGIPDEDRKELQRIFLVLEPATHTVDVPVKSVAQREHEIEARRRLNQEAEALITKIRGYPGLSRFLLPAVFYSIMEGLPDGYVVIVNALSEVRSHALLLSRSSGLASCLELSVPQSKFSWERVKTGLPRSQHLAGTRTNDVTRDDRAFIVSRKSAVPSLENVLASLWKFIACPVLTQLGLQKASQRERPRVWWCLTGTLSLMPIHAAGTDNRADCVWDYAVSSYIPTVSALTRARKAWSPIDRTKMTGLVVAEAAPGRGYTPIPNVNDEIRAVKQVFAGAGVEVLHNTGAQATVAGVVSSLQLAEVNVFHLACHGIQSATPLKSCFVLQDGDLTLEDLMKVELPHAVLAFLSACQTAQGDENHPDQAVHLAASMLFCGFRSVIATMWSMDDEDGPTVARRVYEGLLAKSHLDLDDIPYALDEAVRSLHQAGVPAYRWALYVHMGA